HRFTRRALFTVLFIVLTAPVLLVLVILVYGGIPPSYHEVRLRERGLPQHVWGRSVGVGGGEEGPRYLRFPDHLWGHGLNNVLQEALLTAHVAHASNRTFVFEDYVWSHLPLPYTLYDFALRPTRVPLGAFLGGPLAGGPEKASDERRAISSEYFEHVCPPTPKPPTISGLRVDAPGPPDGSDGVQIVDWFRERLSRDDVRGRRCVLVREEERRVFDANFFGSTLILPLFPSLRESPVIRGFAWSPLVQGALERSTSVLPPHIPGILALHLRRGDYKRHCVRLAHWGAGYMGFNLFEGLDVFDVDAFLAPKALQARKEAYYLEHCLPTIAQIVKRLHVVREEYDVALSVYVLTNGWSSFVDELRVALLEDGWERVVATPDLEDGVEEKGVSVAVDMGLAERAEVFVGNGFSSLSANIVMLRTAKGFPVHSNRF
ncbi:hypothetical protein BDZ97DRAFT_1613701, partial [Flammula alnicola]